MHTCLKEGKSCKIVTWLMIFNIPLLKYKDSMPNNKSHELSRKETKISVTPFCIGLGYQQKSCIQINLHFCRHYILNRLKVLQMNTDQMQTDPHDGLLSTMRQNTEKVRSQEILNALDLGSPNHQQIQHEVKRIKIDGEYLSPPIQSKPPTHNKMIFVEDYEISEASSNGHKSKKNVYSGNKLESLPLFTKQKIMLENSAFETPELTTQSVASSESLERDSSSNGNLLPICSTTQFNHSSYDYQKSFSSVEMLDNCEYQGLCTKLNYAESKYSSGASEFDDILTVCQHCTSLFDKCKRLQAQNEQLSRKNLILNEQLARYEQIDFQEEQNDQSFDEEKEACPQIIKELFLFQIEESYKTLLKVNSLLASFDMDFYENDCRFLEQFWSQFKNIELAVLGKEQKQQKRRQIEQIHFNYKKVITRLIKKFECIQSKKESDFKKFMAALSLSQTNIIKPLSLTPAKTERQRRKLKTYVQRQSSTDECFIKALIQQGKQRIEWLQIHYEHEKEKLRQLQRSQREQDQRHVSQINELFKERIMLKNQIEKYERQFAMFLAKISHQRPQKKEAVTIVDSQFFKDLSQRIFQISNCIPFEQNDEQNLFAPQSESELFDMMERIRKFYLKFQSYNKARDGCLQAQRSLLILFMKSFIEQSKIPQQKILSMLENKKYDNLAFIRQLIYTSKQKMRKSNTMRESKIDRHSLRLGRTHSFMLDSDFPTR